MITTPAPNKKQSRLYNNLQSPQLQGGIDRRATFYLASPQNPKTLRHLIYGESVFARELNQLTSAGYKKVGDYMYPPDL